MLLGHADLSRWEPIVWVEVVQVDGQSTGQKHAAVKSTNSLLRLASTPVDYTRRHLTYLATRMQLERDDHASVRKHLVRLLVAEHIGKLLRVQLGRRVFLEFLALRLAGALHLISSLHGTLGPGGSHILLLVGLDGQRVYEVG